MCCCRAVRRCIPETVSPTPYPSRLTPQARRQHRPLVRCRRTTGSGAPFSRRRFAGKLPQLMVALILLPCTVLWDAVSQRAVVLGTVVIVFVLYAEVSSSSILSLFFLGVSDGQSDAAATDADGSVDRVRAYISFATGAACRHIEFGRVCCGDLTPCQQRRCAPVSFHLIPTPFRPSPSHPIPSHPIPSHPT